MKEPIWIRREEALAIHAQQLSLFGGPGGIRDPGLLDSALARPKNMWAYDEIPPGMGRLAAAYAFGISSNHPFVDGNKRTALVISFVFLEINGLQMIASQEDAYLTFLKLAAGQLSEEELAAWFDRNSAWA